MTIGIHAEVLRREPDPPSYEPGMGEGVDLADRDRAGYPVATEW